MAVLDVVGVLVEVTLGPLVYVGAQALDISVNLGDLLGDVLFACIAIGAALYVFVPEE